MTPQNNPALLESPDGESHAEFARVSDAFPLDPTTAVFNASAEPPSGSGTRPWGLRFAVTPPLRREVSDAVDRWVYDPVSQQGIDRLTGAPSLGKRSSGTKETTGEPDGNKPTPEEVTYD
ncbi:putative ATP-grasp-modified RiPP [Allosalinactinospora lopnorensis]|uniref:putative ATP-grasp-modified RiPP n=1 Tax=Allosalinactinospora lopnorensis TaxID=1352348 RepID=UPI000623BACF|nr:putative ATP-grasp-modified RiPP [Allosalinactinospora lopnorensis]